MGTLFRRKLASIVAVILLACSTPTPQIVAADEAPTPNELFVENTPLEFVVGDPGRSITSYPIQVLLEGSTPGSLKVELVDFVDLQGERELFPGGTLGDSLTRAIALDPIDLRYVPSDGRAVYNLRFRGKSELRPIIYQGLIQISFESDANQGSGVAAGLGVTKELLVTKFGAEILDGGVRLRPAQLASHVVRPVKRSSPIDSLLPDIPGVINFGPIESVVEFANVGSVPVFTELEWVFEVGDEPIAKQNLEREILRPGSGGSFTARSEIANPVNGSTLNVLPSFGLVKVQANLTSSLAGVDLETMSDEKTVLILQWKEPLVLSLAGFLFVRFGLIYRARLNAAKLESGPQTPLSEPTD